MFATGKPQIGEIKGEFQINKAKKMCKAATCPGVLTLPVCHENYGDFKKQMVELLAKVQKCGKYYKEKEASAGIAFLCH